MRRVLSQGLPPSEVAGAVLALELTKAYTYVDWRSLTGGAQVVVVPRFVKEWVPPSGKTVPDWLRESALSSPLSSLGVGSLLLPDAPPSVRVAGDEPGLGKEGEFVFRAAGALRFVLCFPGWVYQVA